MQTRATTDLIPIKVDQLEIRIERRSSFGLISLIAERNIRQEESQERQTGRESFSDPRAVLGVVSSVLCRFSELLEHEAIFPRDAVPRPLEASDRRRVESGENGHERVVIVKGEATLQRKE